MAVVVVVVVVVAVEVVVVGTAVLTIEQFTLLILVHIFAFYAR